MSDKPKRPSRPNRFGLGFLSILQIVIFLAAVVFANYLASENHMRADFSRSGDYTLSSATKSYLESDVIETRERPIKWTMLFRRSSPFYERVRALAEEYARSSNGRIELEIIDPLRSPDRTQQFTAAYNLTLVRDLILIDARPSEETPIVTENTAGTPALNPHITLALAEEMLTYIMDESGQRRPDTFRAEDLLTARLVEAIEGKPRTFLFLADKSRIDTEGDDSPWNNLAATLRYQNIQITPANLAGLKTIPDVINGLAIIAPKYDFTDAEIETLEAYWNTPRAALLILLDAGECPPKLRTFLRSKGVTPQRDRIITKDTTRLITTARGNFTEGVSFIKDLAGQAAVFEGASSSLQIRENADDLIVRKINPTPLIRISDGFWGETDFGKNTADAKEGENFDPIRDNPAPLYLAASVTRGAANDDRFAAETSRMIVVSNTDFLDPDRQRAENIDFLASAANWLVGRDSLTGLSPRTIGTYKMPLLDAQVSFINRLNLFFAPLAFLLIGGLVFSSRRS
ncbi:Gldg family protein [Luteolibacter algae]|uniref:Gldg family protein n=1 Tax=Luteolibacter algae TaxID=454151 RepID=A0ABW5D6F2_9BACT